MDRELRAQLIDDASAPYWSAGRWAYHFARGKLGGDPYFSAVLEGGLVPRSARYLDLGCGQGLLAAWLLAAAKRYSRGEWGAADAPPHVRSYRGIELLPKVAQRGWTGLKAHGDRAVLEVGDMARAVLGEADVVSMMDVIHYLVPAEQEALLRRVRAALAPTGVLLLRVGDAAGGIPFRVSQVTDRTVTLFLGGEIPRMYCRRFGEWQTLLESLAFSINKVMPMGGVGFANVLIVATAQ